MTDTVPEIDSPKPPPPDGKHDVITHRLVVCSLGATVVMTGLNITILQALGKEPNSSLCNLGAVAIGALAMCLSSIMRPNG